MLEKAKAKAARAELTTPLNFIHGDVGDLPFTNEYFDCIGISFAFRNLTYKNPNTPRYLSEIVRVLKKRRPVRDCGIQSAPNKLLRGMGPPLSAHIRPLDGDFPL